MHKTDKRHTSHHHIDNDVIINISTASVSPTPTPIEPITKTIPVQSSSVPIPVVTTKRRVKLSIDSMLPINIKPKVSTCHTVIIQVL